MPTRGTYAAAGVSLATADAVVERLRCRRVDAHGASRTFGAFAGLFALDERRLLVASTDSIGTKLDRSPAGRGKFRWCGADMAAHCINDVLTTGADPLFLLDYVAAAGSTPSRSQSSSRAQPRSAARRAARSSAARPPSSRASTARTSSTSAGPASGSSTAIELIDGSRVAEGDVVVGLASVGDPRERLLARAPARSATDFDADLCSPPTRLYLDDVRALRGRADVHALAHVTGGGIAGQPARACCPPGSASRSTGPPGSAHPFPLARAPGVAEDELRRVFNLGIGYCAVVAGRRRAATTSSSGGRGRVDASSGRRYGVLVSGEGTNLQALIDAGLPIAAVASNRAGARALERADAAGIPTAVFDAAAYPEPRRARRGARGLAPRARRRARRARGLHARAPAALLRGLRAAGRQHALGAAPGVPRRAPDRGRARGRRRRDRRDDPLGRRGRRHRAGDPARAPSRSCRATRPRACARGCRRSSTGCCPRSCGS